MASFLSFVYRRQASAPPSFQSASSSSTSNRQARLSLRDDEDAPRPFLPPGVTSSGSSESADWVSPGDSSDDERPLPSPFTPEGLQPRKSADSLRRELKLSPRTLDNTLKGKRLSGVAKILAGIDIDPIMDPDVSNDDSNIHKQQYSDDDSEDDMILPPPDYLQRRQPTFESSVMSPMVSTSSFYSRSRSQQDRPVAMSPVLQVGQARTAVGALVALREAANRHPNADAGAAEPFPLMEADKLQQKDATRGNKKQLVNKQSLPVTVLPPHTDLVPEKKDCNETENENVPYMPANTPIQRPVAQLPRTISEDDELYASPSSMQLPANEFMPLSEAARKSMDIGASGRPDVVSYELESIRKYDGTSFSQGSSLISTGNVIESDAEGGYDCNEEEFDEALLARKFRNQQMRKQMQLQVQQEEEEEEYGDFMGVEDEDEYEQCEDTECCDDVAYDEYKYAVEEGACEDFGAALVRRKSRNQRHEKEAILYDIVTRLRDNMDLVADIENAASATVAAMGSWFVKTPRGQENLMTGFSAERRTTLLASVDSILRELDIAQPEEFMLSPSKVPVMAVTHDTLTQALLFCRSLISSAIPRAEKNQIVMDLPAEDAQFFKLFLWKCVPELHFALGLNTPQTPDTVRGGGTSLFSLPEESGAETPHTSNVSMATSITSTYTPYRRRYASQPGRPQLMLHHDGLQLRHTVEVVSSLLQKLTLACLNLTNLNSKEKGATLTYVRACDEIKKIYLELVAIKKEDVGDLMEAFYLEAQVPQIAEREIPLIRDGSVDQDDEKVAAKAAQVVAFASAMRASTFPEQHERENSRSSSVRSILLGNTSLDRVNLFSPETEDMRSKATKEEAPFECDDLRRQVGSYDREDNAGPEEREGPSWSSSLVGYASRDGEESEWSQRMYRNVSLAANSIRNLRKQEGAELRELTSIHFENTAAACKQEM